jgi:predicted transcriptional regulator
VVAMTTARSGAFHQKTPEDTDVIARYEWLPPFGQALRHMRHLIDPDDTTQADLIEEMGFTPSSLSYIERGKRLMPRRKYRHMMRIFQNYIDKTAADIKKYPTIYEDQYADMVATYELIRQRYRDLTDM